MAKTLFGYLDEQGDKRQHPPASHASDPQTSKDAERDVTESGVRDKHMGMVLRLVADNPNSTTGELLQRQRYDPPLTEYQVRRRLSDLKDSRAIVRGPARTCTAKGTSMSTWALAPESGTT